MIGSRNSKSLPNCLVLPATKSTGKECGGAAQLHREHGPCQQGHGAGYVLRGRQAGYGGGRVSNVVVVVSVTFAVPPAVKVTVAGEKTQSASDGEAGTGQGYGPVESVNGSDGDLVDVATRRP